MQFSGSLTCPFASGVIVGVHNEGGIYLFPFVEWQRWQEWQGNWKVAHESDRQRFMEILSLLSFLSWTHILITYITSSAKTNPSRLKRFGMPIKQTGPTLDYCLAIHQARWRHPIRGYQASTMAVIEDQRQPKASATSRCIAMGSTAYQGKCVIMLCLPKV